MRNRRCLDSKMRCAPRLRFETHPVSLRSLAGRPGGAGAAVTVDLTGGGGPIYK